MITEYHRPDSIEGALVLYTRANPPTRFMAGGLSFMGNLDRDLAVVDLNYLDLSFFENRGNSSRIGATTTLQSILDQQNLPGGLSDALLQEAPEEIRPIASLAGMLVSSTGDSPLATVLLAAEAKLMLQPGDEEVPLGEILPIRDEWLKGRLITGIEVPKNIDLAFACQTDPESGRLLVSVAVCRWPSGRTRVVVGGFGKSPMLACDGPDSSGAEIAARSAYHEAGDKWASAQVRSEAAGTLTHNILLSMEAGSSGN